MMIRKFLYLGICCVSLFCLTLSASAGNLYRFEDEEGVKTLSRSLPPEAAQKGYDILNDKTMRLIERVPPAPTKEEIAEIKARQAEEAERQRQQAIADKEAEKQREKQARHDRTLMMTYPTEADLIDARDRDINFRKEQIVLLSAKLPKLKLRLERLQGEAAERELGGGKISKNMQKRLDAAQEEISVRQRAIEKYQAEIKELDQQYQRDLERLRQLKDSNSAAR